MAFEVRLIEALQPIRQHVLATVVHHVFDSGLYDSLAAGGGCSLQDLLDRHPFVEVRLRALLHYLANEGLVARRGERYVLTERARGFAEFRGWYTMLIGGYGSTFLQLGDTLRRGSGSAGRAADKVGIGSCAISQYDAIPLTRSLMTRIPGQVKRVLDLGCGNARYLVEFCRAFPDLEAIGVEPDAGGFDAARALVEREALTDRITLIHGGARELFAAELPHPPDLTVLGFVLHEILGQDGEAAAIDFLRQLTRRFPELHVIVIEVDHQPDNPAVMRHGLSLAYYNPYYLFHPFTQQALMPVAYWRELFGRAGLDILAEQTVDREIDSTGLEVGFLLHRAPAR